MGMQQTPDDSPTPPVSWSALATGGANAASLAALAHVDPSGLTGPALVDAIVAAEKALSLLSGVQMRLQAALAVPFTAGDPTRLAARLARKNCATGDENPAQVELFVPEAAVSLAASEIAAALRIAPVTAGIRVRDAETMTTVLAPTLTALEGGVLDRGKARVIAEHCAPLAPEQAATVQHLVLRRAADLSNSELREVTGQAVITVDPDGAADRHEQAAAGRALMLAALPDAMASLRAILPADGAVKIFQLSDLLATGTAGAPGDFRGIAARRVDAWVDIAEQLLTHGHVNLTGYLGQPLPDHSQPPPRPPRGTRSPGATDGNDPSETQCTAGSPDTETHTGIDSAGGTSSVLGDLFTPGDTSWASNDDAGSPGTCVDAEAEACSDALDAAATDRTEGPSGVRIPAGACIGPETGSVHSIPTGIAVTTGIETSEPPMSSPAGEGAERDRRILTRQGRRPHLSVVIGMSTLAELDDLPALLAGYGAIPAGIARSIAASAATITALTADAGTGTLTRAGALTYRPRQELRDQITALLSTCQFPSCRQPSWRCDIDHQNPFDRQYPERGGPTTPDNTAPMCRRHHLYKHHTDWHVHADPTDLVVTWASPTGHSYTRNRQQVVPPRIWITTPASAAAQTLDDRDTFASATLTAPPPTAAGASAMTTSSSTSDSQGAGACASASSGAHAGTVSSDQWTGDDGDQAVLDATLIRDQLNRPALHFDLDAAAWNTDAGAANDIPSLRHNPSPHHDSLQHHDPSQHHDSADQPADFDGEEPPPF